MIQKENIICFVTLFFLTNELKIQATNNYNNESNPISVPQTESKKITDEEWEKEREEYEKEREETSDNKEISNDFYEGTEIAKISVALKGITNDLFDDLFPEGEIKSLQSQIQNLDTNECFCLKKKYKKKENIAEKSVYISIFIKKVSPERIDILSRKLEQNSNFVDLEKSISNTEKSLCDCKCCC